MKFTYQDKEYDVVIDKKKTTKNTYIRVKDNNIIYVTTNFLVSEKAIKKLIDSNEKSIIRMINAKEKKKANNQGFYYLGKCYEIVYVDYCDISFGDVKVFLNKNLDIDKWYKNKAKDLFQKHLDLMYNNFSRNIPYPSLRIRKMTSRWGVCNIKTKTVTLNLELIKRDTKYLDYVIIHELSHLLEANHSAKFWLLVEENYPNYKEIRKQMKDF